MRSCFEYCVWRKKSNCNHLCDEFSDGRREAAEGSLKAVFGDASSVDYDALLQCYEQGAR